jgi:hypothetical protein
VCSVCVVCASSVSCEYFGKVLCGFLCVFGLCVCLACGSCVSHVRLVYLVLREFCVLCRFCV